MDNDTTSLEGMLDQIMKHDNDEKPFHWDAAREIKKPIVEQQMLARSFGNNHFGAEITKHDIGLALAVFNNLHSQGFGVELSVISDTVSGAILDEDGIMLIEQICPVTADLLGDIKAVIIHLAARADEVL